MGKGLKSAGLVMGIVGIVCSIVGIVFWPLAIIGLPVSIIGLVLAIVGQKKESSTLGTAAFVISLLAVIFSAITFFTCGLCFICAVGIDSALSWVVF